MNALLILIALSPILTEIMFDHYRWKNGLDDKPISTYLRVASFILLAFVMAFIAPQDSFIRSLITGGLFLYGTHLLLFDYTLNISRPGIHILYHSDDDYWINIKIFGKRFALPMNGVPWYGELLWKLIISYSLWVAYFHWDWICCNAYPGALIDYFKF